ncbi:MAG: ABC transporter substrate-binding protein [Cardiobacteriaceae bacterium]|nr:ABC transporter substrate-binding protein [Cardiobacteriaceae bacterium]
MTIKRAFLAAALASAMWLPAQAEQVVAITQIVAHPALDDAYKGVLDELAEAGYRDGDKIRVVHEIAQGDQAIATQIAKKFAGDKPAVIVAISTPSAQSVAAAARDIPIVFTAVTDPVAAKLVDNLEKPGKNITGYSDAVSTEYSVDMVKNILPEAKVIGTIYNPGEANSVVAVEALEKVVVDKGLSLVKAPANKSSEVLDAARSLQGKADALLITTDNTVVSALPSVIQAGEKGKLPVFTVDTSSVEQGAIAAVGFGYYDLGRATGKQVAQILGGSAAGDIPVGFMKAEELYLNPKAAEKMGVAIPDAVRQSASKIIGE